MNHINICPSCIHRNNCVLTTQKEKVWSCSEFDEVIFKKEVSKRIKLPQQKNTRELELV